MSTVPINIEITLGLKTITRKFLLDISQETVQTLEFPNLLPNRHVRVVVWLAPQTSPLWRHIKKTEGHPPNA